MIGKNSYIIFLFCFFIACERHDEKAQKTDADSTTVNYYDSIKQAKLDFKSSNNSDFLCKLAIFYIKNKQRDSAFSYIEQIIDIDSTINIFNEPSFYELINESKWKILEQKQLLKSIKKNGKPYKDDSLVIEFWRMLMADQAYYSDMLYYSDKFGHDNLIADSLRKIKDKINEENQKKLEDIINKVGWPKISEYGEMASSSAFLIVQHSNIDFQKKSILTIKNYCEIKEAHWGDYCLMLDRILMQENKYQIYGSQLSLNIKTNKYEVYPIDDPHEVDKRRKEKGMMPIKEYLMQFGINFDVPQTN